MPDLTDISISMHGSLWLMTALLLMGVGTIYFMYRATVPPLPLLRRVLLALVRFGAVAAITGMLFTPVITLTLKQEKMPTLAVLIDNSASMQVEDRLPGIDNPVMRGTVALEVLKNTLFESLSGDFNIRNFQFSRRTEELFLGMTDSIVFNGEGTDISGALDHIVSVTEHEPIRGIVLLTDGINNLGINPVKTASESGIPVYPVGIGDATPQKDIMVSNLQVNEIAYSGKTIPVTVSIQSSGYGESPATVTLSSDGVTLDTRVMRLPDNNRVRSVTLNFTPAEAKTHRLSVAVSGRDDEISSLNNRQEFFVKVLESQTNVLIYSSRPSQDYAFLKRSLEENESFSVTGIVRKSGGSYYSVDEPLPDRWNSVHVFVLIDLDESGVADNVLNSLRSAIEGSNKPVLYLRGKSLTRKHLAALSGIVPVKNLTNRGKEEEVFLHLSEQAFEHPVFRISEDPGINHTLWRKIPPVFTSGYIPVPGDNSEIMWNIDLTRSPSAVFNNTTPLLFLNRTGRKTLFINAYNLWRWKLMALRDPELTGFYDTFFYNCIRWLINREDSKLFHISSNKDFYKNGEQIVINAQVYNENYEAVSNAEVQITIRKPGVTLNRMLQSIGEGRYSSSVEILEAGEYTISGIATRNERQLGTDGSEFIIGQFSGEMQKTVMDSILLKQIASVSNGRYFSSNNIRNIRDYIDSSRETEFKTLDIEFWNKGWFMVLIVTLLSLEWFFRKRLGML